MKNFLFLILFIGCHPQCGTAQSLQWVRQIGADKIDRALSVTIDAQGNTYTTGHFQDTVDFDPGPGSVSAVATSNGEAYILKLDPSGSFVRAWMFGKTTGGHIATASKLAFDGSGNMYVSGYYTGSNVDFDPDTAIEYKMSYIGSGTNAFVMKLDASGSFIWAKRWFYGKDDGTTREEGPAMALDASGSVYTAGRFEGSVDFDPDTGKFILPGRWEDGYISKLDAAGNLVWAKHLATDTPNSNYVFPRSVSLDASGNVYVAGTFNGTADFDPDTTIAFKLTSASPNGFLLKLDPSGNFLWVKRIGTDQLGLLEYHRANAVSIDGAGNAYVTGSFMNTVAFGAASLKSAGLSDIYIAKVDPSGNFLWARQLGSLYDTEEGTRIVTDASGYVYTTGVYRSTVDFDPGGGVYEMTSNGVMDVFVLKLSASGDFIWAKGFGSSSSAERIDGIAVSGNDIYTVGKFAGTTNFDPNGIYNLTAAITGTSYHDAFIHKMSQNPNGIQDVDFALNTAIFPNPASGHFTIDLTVTGMKAATVTLLDMQGRKVFETNMNSPITRINAAGLPRGVYLLKLQCENGCFTRKLVVE